MTEQQGAPGPRWLKPPPHFMLKLTKAELVGRGVELLKKTGGLTKCIGLTCVADLLICFIVHLCAWPAQVIKCSHSSKKFIK